VKPTSLTNSWFPQGLPVIVFSRIKRSMSGISLPLRNHACQKS